MENPDVTNFNLIGDEFSSVTAKEAIANLIAGIKASIKARRASMQTTKAQRKANRLSRKANRKLKKAKGIPLTASEFADESLDIQEAKKDGESNEAVILATEAVANGNPDVSEDTITSISTTPVNIPPDNTAIIDASANTDEKGKNKTDDEKILGMPKVVFFIGLGVVVLAGGFIAYKMIKKKSTTA